MKILIDADGCPVVQNTIKIAINHAITCVIFCDFSHRYDIDSIQTISVSIGKDSVDFEILKYLNIGDIVITQDYGLAAMCLARGCHPINQDGMLFTENNIDRLLDSRYLAKKIRMQKGRIKGNSKRNKAQDIDFEVALTNLIFTLL